MTDAARQLSPIHGAPESLGAATGQDQVEYMIVLTPYPVGPNHTLISIARMSQLEWRPEMRANARHIAEGENAGIVINKAASINDYNKAQANQKEHLRPPDAKMSFKVFLIGSETGKLTLEHRTLRFWLSLAQDNHISNGKRLKSAPSLDISQRTFNNIKQESSKLAQAYFCQLIGTTPDDDFPKNYAAFIMKLMRLLKKDQFLRVIKMEVEMRQLAQEEHAKPSSRASSLDGGSNCSGSNSELSIAANSALNSNSSTNGNSRNGRGSPLTSQKVLDIIESSYPNPISIKDICSNLHAHSTTAVHLDQESLVRQFLEDLTNKEKINTTDGGQHFTRTTKLIDTKVNLVKQMPKVIRSKQPVIAIITAQYCEKLAVDSMISDKETFVRYRTNTATTNSNSEITDFASSSSANYVYTLGNIGDHRVVSTKLTSIGHSRGALIAAGNATTRLLGTFPELEYIFLVGCAGGIVSYTDFSSHVRLGDVVVSHVAPASGMATSSSQDDEQGRQGGGNNRSSSSSLSGEHIYVHCRPEQHPKQHRLVDPVGSDSTATSGQRISSMAPSYSVHKNLKHVAANGGAHLHKSFDEGRSAERVLSESQSSNKQEQELTYEQCHFRLWRPTKLDLQELSQRLWLQGLENPQARIWQYYIEEGIKSLKQLDIEASRPPGESDKLFMSIGPKDSIEVNHPEPSDDEIDLRREGWPMCHFGPIGSAALQSGSISEPLKQRMISEFQLRAFDSEFDPVVESIYGNCKESYIMIRGICDYKDGRKRNDWQQYSALVAAAFMKSIIVNLKPL